MDSSPSAPLPKTPDDDQGHPLRYWIALTVTLASLLEGLDTSVVNVSLPQMMSALGVSLDQITGVTTGYIVATVITIPLTGWLAALFGRKKYFAGSLLLFTFASFMCGVSVDLTEMVIWRIIQGIGGGALIATSQAIIYEVFPKREHSKAMAIWGMGIMVGPAIGPPLGGYLTDALSWRWIFFINIPVGIVALLAVWALVPNSPYREKVKKIDVPGLTLLAIGIGSLQMLLNQGQSLGWYNSSTVWIYTAMTFGCLGVLIWWELFTKEPVVDLRVLANAQFTACALFTFVQAMCTLAIVFVTPLMLMDLMGYSAMQTGFIMLPVALGTGIIMFIVGRFASRFNPYAIILIGVGIFLFAMFRYSYFTATTPREDFFMPLLLRGIGLGMIFVPLNALAVADLPKNKIPAATGLLNLLRWVGSSVGIAISATILGKIEEKFTFLLKASNSEENPIVKWTFREVVRSLKHDGLSHHHSTNYALDLLNNQYIDYAKTLAFERIFAIFGIALILVVPLMLFMRVRPDESAHAPAGH